jgi:hypothetical protein
MPRHDWRIAPLVLRCDRSLPWLSDVGSAHLVLPTLSWTGNGFFAEIRVIRSRNTDRKLRRRSAWRNPVRSDFGIAGQFEIGGHISTP